MQFFKVTERSKNIAPLRLRAHSMHMMQTMQNLGHVIIKNIFKDEQVVVDIANIYVDIKWIPYEFITR